MKMILKMRIEMKIKNTLINLFKFYQKYVSVFTKPHCRYIPTCSSYAIESVEKYGAFKGLWLTTKRFLRCNPLFKGGYDPVP